MIRKFFYILVGILLLPLLAGFAVEFYRVLEEINFCFEIHPALVYGFLAYIALHIVFFKPIMTYVFAHEFTHALWAIPFGGKLKDFRAGESGGYAVVTRSNLIVAIAPYFFPLYTYLVLGLFGIFISAGIRETVFPYICFLTGLTLSFHLIFTGLSLLKKQSDLRKGGMLLSIALILILNMVFIVLIFKVLDSDTIRFVPFLKDSINYSIALVLKNLNRFV